MPPTHHQSSFDDDMQVNVVAKADLADVALLKADDSLDVPTASDPAPAGENKHITRRGLASFGVHPLLQGKSVQRITHAEGVRCRCRGSVHVRPSSQPDHES